jgi:hypothetical protein
MEQALDASEVGRCEAERRVARARSAVRA